MVNFGTFLWNFCTFPLEKGCQCQCHGRAELTAIDLIWISEKFCICFFLSFLEKFDNFKGSGLIATHMVDWRCVKREKIHRIKTRTRNQTARKAIWTRGQFDRICMSCLYTWLYFKCNCICIHICISSVYNDLNTCIYLSCLYTCLYFKHICIL